MQHCKCSAILPLRRNTAVATQCRYCSAIPLMLASIGESHGRAAMAALAGCKAAIEGHNHKGGRQLRGRGHCNGEQLRGLLAVFNCGG
jgi:hypothetical protein